MKSQKNAKKLLLLVLVLALTVCLSVVFASCGKDDANKIQLTVYKGYVSKINGVELEIKSPGGKYNLGDVVTVVADYKKDEGETFNNWTVNSLEVSKTATYTFTLEKNTILYANINPAKIPESTECKVAIHHITSNGEIYKSSTIVKKNSLMTVVANKSNPTAYRFKEWRKQDGSLSNLVAEVYSETSSLNVGVNNLDIYAYYEPLYKVEIGEFGKFVKATNSRGGNIKFADDYTYNIGYFAENDKVEISYYRNETNNRFESWQNASGNHISYRENIEILVNKTTDTNSTQNKYASKVVTQYFVEKKDFTASRKYYDAGENVFIEDPSDAFISEMKVNGVKYEFDRTVKNYKTGVEIKNLSANSTYEYITVEATNIYIKNLDGKGTWDIRKVTRDEMLEAGQAKLKCTLQSNADIIKKPFSGWILNGVLLSDKSSEIQLTKDNINSNGIIVLEAVYENTFTQSDKIEVESSAIVTVDQSYEKLNSDAYSSIRDALVDKSSTFLLPGLIKNENLSIKGIVYDTTSDCFILSGYRNLVETVTGSPNNSVLMLVTSPDIIGGGKLVKTIFLQNIDGTSFTGKISGLTMTGNSLFITTGENCIYRVNKLDVDKACATAYVKMQEKIIFPIAINSCTFAKSDTNNNMNIGKIWVSGKAMDTFTGVSVDDEVILGYAFDERRTVATSNEYMLNGFNRDRYVNGKLYPDCVVKLKSETNYTISSILHIKKANGTTKFVIMYNGIATHYDVNNLDSKMYVISSFDERIRANISTSKVESSVGAFVDLSLEMTTPKICPPLMAGMCIDKNSKVNIVSTGASYSRFCPIVDGKTCKAPVSVLVRLNESKL